MSDQEVDETELAFQRLREVLSAPDRGWRRGLRRRRAEPDDAATEEGFPGSSKAGILLAAPLLGAALLLMISTVRPGAGGGPGPSDRRSAAANNNYRGAAAPGEAEAAEASPPARRRVAGRSERVWPSAPISVEGTTVSIGDRRWAVGATGDVVIVGDWDCDGAPTPAVLRPSDGSFHVFDRWAGAGEAATARRIVAFPGAVTAAAAGCGSAIVTTALGEEQRVETAPAGR